MRLRLLKFLAVIATLFIFPGALLAQRCMPTGLNGSVINLSCNTICTTLNFQVPHLKATSDYTLLSVPYNPYPYVTPTGGEDFVLYNDDRYSNTIPLPFNFCFYDSTFSNVVVGSNGILTFEVANGTGTCFNGYVLAQPIPWAGGTICSPTTYYPRSAIMGAYSDIDPSAGASPAGRKIQWEIYGTAPCRKFVVSYNRIGVYGNSCGLLSPNTFQIVLHEASGIVEVYFEQKSCFSSTNGGRAILGMQNWNRDQAIAAPGKNNTIWSENNTGYRFIPSGGASRFLNAQLFTMAGTLVATADTATSATGLLDISFPNVCFPSGSNQFEIRTSFSSCGPGSPTILSLDTITVNQTGNLNATATSTSTACGPPSGTITATVPAGVGVAPFTFVLDAGAPVTLAGNSHTFIGVAQGSHSVVITDATGTCSSTINNIVVNQTNVLNGVTSSTGTSCPGVNNGTVTATPTNGSAPYTFSLDGGPPQSGAAPFTFSNVAAGLHTVVIRDVSGCVSLPIPANVSAGAALVVNTSSMPTSCNGAVNGSVTATPATGNGPYDFSLDGGAPQSASSTYTFTNVSAGLHSISVRDAAGCVVTNIPVIVNSGPLLTTTLNKTDVLCNGTATGTITVTQPTAGNPPYAYSLDGVNWQSSNVFTGLLAGTFNVFFREANGCTGSANINVAEPAPLVASHSTIDVVCNGQNNGTIIVSPSGGVGSYQYSINGGTNWQNTDTFYVPAGNYTLLIRDANNCLIQRLVVVTEPAALTVIAANTNASCDGGDDGNIVVTANGGNGNYQYSLDGVNFQTSNTFKVGPGNHVVRVKDDKGCMTPFSTQVGLNNNLVVSQQTDPTICEGNSQQLQLISNATQFRWSPVLGLNDPAVANPVANPVITTQYIVSATLGRCSSNDTVIVNVNPAPVPDAGPDGFICFGQTYQLLGSGGAVYAWTPGTYLNIPSVSNPIVTPGKTITYTLSTIDALGCKSLITDNVTVDVTPPIKVTTYPFDTVGYPGDRFQLLANSIANMYSWSPAIGLNDPNIPNPMVSVGALGDDILYRVTASTIAGCKGEGFVKVRVYKGPDIYMPTGFTPNSDGKNDKFTPFPVGIQKINSFRVFNRWGQLLFRSNKLHDGWDGRFGGQEQNNGVYVWMIEAVTKDNRVISKKGTVLLIR